MGMRQAAASAQRSLTMQATSTDGLIPAMGSLQCIAAVPESSPPASQHSLGWWLSCPSALFDSDKRCFFSPAPSTPDGCPYVSPIEKTRSHHYSHLMTLTQTVNRVLFKDVREASAVSFTKEMPFKEKAKLYGYDLKRLVHYQRENPSCPAHYS